MRAFIDRAGRTPKQAEVDGAGVKVGRWVTGVRAEFRAGRLTDDRVRVLRKVPGILPT